MLVDTFAARLLEQGSGGAWRERSGALVFEARTKTGRLLLVKPQLFMNRSGGPLAEVAQFYKIPVAEIAVAHDEVDLPLGSLRIKVGGGDGGHNGIKSVIGSFGSPDFVRIRLGIGRPPSPQPTEAGIAGWVLGRFGGEEQSVVQELMTRGVLAIEALCAEGAKVAQNRFNS